MAAHLPGIGLDCPVHLPTPNAVKRVPLALRKRCPTRSPSKHVVENSHGSPRPLLVGATAYQREAPQPHGSTVGASTSSSTSISSKHAPSDPAWIERQASHTQISTSFISMSPGAHATSQRKQAISIQRPKQRNARSSHPPSSTQLRTMSKHDSESKSSSKVVSLHRRNQAGRHVSLQPLSDTAQSLVHEVVQEMSRGRSVLAYGLPPSPARAVLCLTAAIERVLAQPPPEELVASSPMYATGPGTPPRVLAILVCPTHQLATQAHELAHDLLAVSDHRAHVQLMHGGAPIEDDLLALRTTCPALLVSTPGRLMHLVSQGAQVRLEHLLGGVRMVVLDGAEELLAVPAIRCQVDAALRGLSTMAGGKRSRVAPRAAASHPNGRQLLITAATPEVLASGGPSLKQQNQQAEEEWRGGPSSKPQHQQAEEDASVDASASKHAEGTGTQRELGGSRGSGPGLAPSEHTGAFSEQHELGDMGGLLGSTQAWVHVLDAVRVFTGGALPSVVPALQQATQHATLPDTAQHTTLPGTVQRANLPGTGAPEVQQTQQQQKRTQHATLLGSAPESLQQQQQQQQKQHTALPGTGAPEWQPTQQQTQCATLPGTRAPELQQQQQQQEGAVTAAQPTQHSWQPRAHGLSPAAPEEGATAPAPSPRHPPHAQLRQQAAPGVVASPSGAHGHSTLDPQTTISSIPTQPHGHPTHDPLSIHSGHPTQVLLPVRFATAPVEELPAQLLSVLLAHAQQAGPSSRTLVLCPTAAVAAVWAAAARGMGLPALELHSLKSAQYRSEALGIFKLRTPQLGQLGHDGGSRMDRGSRFDGRMGHDGGFRTDRGRGWQQQHHHQQGHHQHQQQESDAVLMHQGRSSVQQGQQQQQQQLEQQQQRQEHSRQQQQQHHHHHHKQHHHQQGHAVWMHRESSIIPPGRQQQQQQQQQRNAELLSGRQGSVRGVDGNAVNAEGGGGVLRGGLVLFSAGGLTQGVELPGLSMVLQVGLPRTPQRVKEVMYHMHSRLQQQSTLLHSAQPTSHRSPVPVKKSQDSSTGNSSHATNLHCNTSGSSITSRGSRVKLKSPGQGLLTPLHSGTSGGSTASRGSRLRLGGPGRVIHSDSALSFGRSLVTHSGSTHSFGRGQVTHFDGSMGTSASSSSSARSGSSSSSSISSSSTAGDVGGGGEDGQGHLPRPVPPPPILNVMLMSEAEGQQLGAILRHHHHRRQQQQQQQQQQQRTYQQVQLGMAPPHNHHHHQHQANSAAHPLHQHQQRNQQSLFDLCPPRQQQQQQQWLAGGTSSAAPAAAAPAAVPAVKVDDKLHSLGSEVAQLLAQHHRWMRAPPIEPTLVAKVQQAQKRAIQRVPPKRRAAAFTSLLAFYRQHPLVPMSPEAWRQMGTHFCRALELSHPPLLPRQLAHEWGPEWLGTTFRAVPPPPVAPSPAEVAAAEERKRLHRHWLLMKAAKKQRRQRKTAAAAAIAAAAAAHPAPSPTSAFDALAGDVTRESS